MKLTGQKVTKSESCHFQSIARHIVPIANSIHSDMNFCQSHGWEDLDRAYVLGKIEDLKHNMQEMQQVLDDMLKDLW